MTNLQLIRPNEVAQLLSISIPTLYRRMKQPDFPDKVRISKRAVGFRKSEIREWVEKQTERKYETDLG